MKRNISRLLSTLLVLCMSLALLPTTAQAARVSNSYGGSVTYLYSDSTDSAPSVSSGISVTVDGKAVAWTDAEPFIDENRRTMVPLRAVGDALGLAVDWDNTLREAIFTNGMKTIYFPIDSTTARTSDSQNIQMDTAAVIVNGRTYAPVRYLAEFFGFAVSWDGTTRTVLIATPDSAGSDGYKLSVGAKSEYELYEIMVDFLNNGFHYDDLKDVWDVNLMIAFYSKWRENSEDIFTLGMNYDKSCALIARLRDKAASMDSPVRETPAINDNGASFYFYIFDEELVDYNAFQSEFPDSMQAQIIQNYVGFKNFIRELRISSSLSQLLRW